LKKNSLCYSIVYYYNVHKGTSSFYGLVDSIGLWSFLVLRFWFQLLELLQHGCHTW